MARQAYWGVLWDALVAILLFLCEKDYEKSPPKSLPWRCLWSDDRLYSLSIALISASLRRGASPWFVLEAALETLPMLYCIIFAVHQTKGNDRF